MSWSHRALAFYTSSHLLRRSIAAACSDLVLAPRAAFRGRIIYFAKFHRFSPMRENGLSMRKHIKSVTNDRSRPVRTKSYFSLAGKREHRFRMVNVENDVGDDTVDESRIRHPTRRVGT